MRRVVILCWVLVAGLATVSADEPTPKPEPLPSVPKADPKSELVALQPDKSLYLEKKPDGSRRVLFSAEVCLIRGPLELFMCKKGSKEHEAILRVATDVQFIHAALEAAGAKAGSPVQYVNPKTEKDEFKVPTGQTIGVSLHYTKDGKTHTDKAQDWITDRNTKKPMLHEWVFAGSRVYKDPDDPKAKPFYCANNGDVISISNFPDAMLDLPVQVDKDDAVLNYEANTSKIPPLGSMVWVIFEAKKK
jgi:hypothetical protein